MTEFSDLLLTPAGLARLRARLARKFVEYKDIRAQRQIAFELSGDGWHDNPEFNRAQQMEANCNREIKKLSDMLTKAQVVTIANGRRRTDAVEVGSLVTFKRWGDDGAALPETWEIGGHGDSDPQRKIVAYDAPLGAALYGLRIGEYAEEVQLGEQLLDLEVIALHPEAPCRTTWTCHS